MSNKKYNPRSHFFVDHTALAPADPNNPNAETNKTDYESYAFGPIGTEIDGQKNMYRTTSFVKATDKTTPFKVYAICEGHVLIFPQTGDPNKINLVLIPRDSPAPLKIKYFIYRGLSKDCFIQTDGNICYVETTDFSKRLINEYQAWNGNKSDDLPASKIGYDESNDYDSFSIEEYIALMGYEHTENHEIKGCQFAPCHGGEVLGYFKGEIGLDIILDYGDADFGNSGIFCMDVQFAKSREHVFDLSLIQGSVMQKRYKEHIHRFLDASAFWGSHIECGEIRLCDGRKLLLNDEVADELLSKYQTGRHVYIYIQEREGRSYGYYDNVKNVYGLNDDKNGKLYETYGWPVLIENIETVESEKREVSRRIQLQYIIAPSIDVMDEHLSIDAIVVNGNTQGQYPEKIARNKLQASDKGVPVTVNFPVYNGYSCSTFLFISANLKQELPLSNYYNDLWPVCVDTPAYLRNKDNFWYTYGKERLINVDEMLDAGAVIQNKMVHDVGKHHDTGEAKSRRLFMAVVNRNTTRNPEYDAMNISNMMSGFSKYDWTGEEYMSAVYDRDPDFSLYKGKIMEFGVAINTLSLYHQTHLFKKCSYFQLGILESEFQTIVESIPPDADQVFLHLESDSFYYTESSRNKQPTEKYRLGISYENSQGSRKTAFPISSIAIYTIDGFYFFSTAYSAHQPFCNEFANAIVEFTTHPEEITIPDPEHPGSTCSIFPYNGEFGFDWLRTIISLPGSNHEEPPYFNCISGGYKRGSKNGFGNYIEAYHALKKQYFSLPAYTCNEAYFVPYLTLFSQGTSEKENIAPDMPAPPFQANLRVIVTINKPIEKLVFDYDKSIFGIELGGVARDVLSDRQTCTQKISADFNVTITCKKEFSQSKQIRVLAYSTTNAQPQLAGLICVNRNDSTVRKRQNILLVKVESNVDDNDYTEKGFFTLEEKTILANGLYQSLIIPVFEDFVDSMLQGEDSYYIHVENNPDFKKGRHNPKYVYGTNAEIVYYENATPPLDEYLKSLLPMKYKNYLTLFSFDEQYRVSQDNIGTGRAQGIGILNAVIYRARTNTTLVHEALHCLGLCHTHLDVHINSSSQLFIYPNANENQTSRAKATYNLMSYNNKKNCIWHWQSKIILKNKK